MTGRARQVDLGAMSAGDVVSRVAEILSARYAGGENEDRANCPCCEAASAWPNASSASEPLTARVERERPRNGEFSDALSCECDITKDLHVGRMLDRIGGKKHERCAAGSRVFVEVAPRKARRGLAGNLMRHSRQECTEDEPNCANCPIVSFCVEGRNRNALETSGPTVVDLFAGAGALGLGFRDAGFRIMAAVEIDRDAAQTYRLNHPGVPVLEAPVEAVTADGLRKWLPTLISPSTVVAGPPCQGYSAAGSRDTEDQRNLLFRHVGRLASELGASSVVIENVPGLRRVNGVTYTNRITASLRRRGYRTWKQPVALRASDFGVPQNRQRLFFVGVKGEVELPEPPSPTYLRHDDDVVDSSLPRTRSLSEALHDLPVLDSGAGSSRMRLPDGRVVLNSQAMRHSPRVVEKIREIKPGGGPISYRRLEKDVARTLVAGHRALPVHPEQHRTITVREAARIQGFPDDYFFCGTRSNQPLQVANAVPPALAQAVASQLLSSLEGT